MSISSILYKDRSVSSYGNHDAFPRENRDITDQYRNKTAQKANKLRETIRTLDKRNEIKTDAKGRVIYSSTSEARMNGYLDMKQTKKTDKKKDEYAVKQFHYNYREISSQIQRAKTSVNAGQAVSKAKRKVMELKRELSSGKGDTEEIQLAISHAKSMERAARKKKRHLETEELIEATQKRDEALKEAEEKSDSSGAANKGDMISMAEEKIEDAESRISEMEEAKAEEYLSSGLSDAEYEKLLSDSSSESFEEMSAEMVTETDSDISSEFSDALMAGLQDMLEEYSGEAREMLEETMEQLEGLEAVDPHMSKGEYEKLKTRHRLSERKDIVKADTDYLKGMFDHLEKEKSMNMGAGAVASPVSSAIMPSVAQASAAEVAMAGIDVLA